MRGVPKWFVVVVVCGVLAGLCSLGLVLFALFDYNGYLNSLRSTGGAILGVGERAMEDVATTMGRLASSAQFICG